MIHKTNNRKLDIIVKSNSGDTVITIIDNGVGRKQSQVLKTRGTGKGLGIVANIVDGYNKLNNRNISYKIIDLVDDKGAGVGTEVRVEV